MARPTRPARSSQPQAVSGNAASVLAGSSAAVIKRGQPVTPNEDRRQIAKPWQIEAYRHVNICGEARYSAALFASLGSRAEIGVSAPNALVGKAQWVNEGPEVELLAELMPTVRDRSRLVRSYMTHYTIGGECYLIARERRANDPGYVPPPDGYKDWDEAIKDTIESIDPLDPDFDVLDAEAAVNPNIDNPIWEIVGVTDIRRKTNNEWEVRFDNDSWLTLKSDDPVIRIWNADPENRREAWSPFRSLLPTLREIEWLTKHIFTQVRTRMIGAGVWFVPDNMTFPPPPPDAVQGGAEAIAAMNEAEQFMVSIAASGMQMLDADEVAYPTVVMAESTALDAVSQDKLIKFWSEIDDKAMTLRADSVRRFALGMDMPPEQILGSSGIAVSGAGGSAGSVNHWGVWANEEQTISAHIEPALDTFVAALTASFLQLGEKTDLVVAYDTASLRLRQDRAKESIELYDRGQLKGEVMLRENGFDPQNDRMDEEEFKRWVLVKLASGSATPEMVQAAVALLGVPMPALEPTETGDQERAKGRAGVGEPPSLEGHPYKGPPREQHDHSDAPFSVQEAAAEVLVLRALEKAGNVLLNNGKRGKDRDRSTPAHLAHVAQPPEKVPNFDFSLADTVYGDLTASQRAEKERQLRGLCADLYREGAPYTRAALIERLRGL